MSEIQTAPVDNAVNTDNAEESAEPKIDQLALLKERADLMGIKYHPSIGIDTLREKINAALTVKEDAPAAAAEAPVAQNEYQRNATLRNEANKLVRVIVNCHNPAKQLWPGEVFTVSNRAIGVLKKFVPYNNEAGWHIPNAIYQAMLERRCPIYVTHVDPRTKFKTRKQKLIKEFTITVLPQLTQEELEELARQQALGNNID